MQDLEKQLGDSEIEIRRRAVEQIRETKGPASVALLLKAMGDVSWRVRKKAGDILFEDYPIGEYIQGMIGLLYIEDNAGARNSAIESLIRLGKKATPFLIEAYKTPNRDVRKFLIDVIGEQMDDRSLPLMLEAIEDEDENVRITAVEHLGKRREASVVDALIEILKKGDLWTAYPAADALGRIGDRKAIPCLVEALGKKPLREPALKSLGLLADLSTLERIVPLLEDPSKAVQQQALRTIELFYHKGVSAEEITLEMKRLLGERTLKILIDYAWSTKREVRMSAILLLGLMRDEAAYGPLLDISHEEDFAEDVKKALVFIGQDNPGSLLKLFQTDNSHQRRFICEVAAKIASPVHYDAIEKLLDDEDGHVRSLAAIGISRIGDLRIIGKMKLLLVDRFEDVQEAAVEALFNLRKGLSVEELISMLGDQNPVLRRNAAKLLGILKAEQAVEALGFTLKDDNVRVRRVVVEALARIGTDDAVRHLIYALTDETPDIRISSVLSLGSIGGDAGLESLLILASDPDHSVRVAAANSMGIKKDPRAIDTLISLLKDDNGFVVASAIESLAAIRGDKAGRAISGMLSSRDLEIRRTAISCLENFTGMEELIVPFLKDPDWATRMAAVKLLGKSRDDRIRSELEKLLDIEEDPTVIKAVEDIFRV